MEGIGTNPNAQELALRRGPGSPMIAKRTAEMVPRLAAALHSIEATKKLFRPIAYMLRCVSLRI